MAVCCQGDHGDDDLTAALRELAERGRHVPLVVFGARCGRPRVVQQVMQLWLQCTEVAMACDHAEHAKHKECQVQWAEMPLCGSIRAPRLKKCRHAGSLHSWKWLLLHNTK